MVLFLLALALAMDSVALSLVNGANCQNLPLFQVIKMAFLFGFFQALMPFLGYILGLSFVNFIAFIDHFIAFGILVFLGIKMIKESKGTQTLECKFRLSNKELVAGAIATSIDALAVGVTFSFENTDIFYACGMIGAVCFVLCIVAFFTGKKLGVWLGKRALVLGGTILIFIGCKILVEHLKSIKSNDVFYP